MASMFPAIRGQMGQSEFYCAVLTLGEAARLVQFVEDVDDWTSVTEPEAKTQRKLNAARVEREMVPYLTDVPDHFYSALTVEVRPPLDRASEGIPFEPLGVDLPGGMELGRMVLDGTEILSALDGQHRLKSMQLAIRQEPRLAREQIAVIFVPFRSPKKSQLLFSDLNRYARTPSKSINLLFSHRDPLVSVAKRLSERVDFLRDRVELESTSLSKHTPAAITLSTLYEMTKALLSDRTVTVDSVESDAEYLRGVWERLVPAVEPWRMVADKEEHPAYLRAQFLVMHGVGQQALAVAIGPSLTRFMNGDRISRALQRIDWRISNTEWQGIAVQGRHVNNTSTTIKHLAGLLRYRLGLTLEPSVASALITQIELRGDPVPPRLARIANSGGRAA